MPLRREALAVGHLTVIVSMLRAPIDVGPRDAGELSTASWVLGVAHPTGAPLSIALGGLFARIPLGTIAFRQGLLMALAVGIAVALAADVVVRDVPSRRGWPAALTVASIVLAPTILRAATMTEVYAVSLALVSCAWWVASLPRAPTRGRLFAIGALVALALAAHVTARVLVPLALLPAFARGVRARGISRSVGASFGGFVLALPMVAWVPVAARRLPPLSWGDARTLRAFLRHFMASDIQAAFAERTHAGNLLGDVRALFSITFLDAGPGLLALALVGLLLLFAMRADARHRGLGVVALGVAFDAIYAAKINPMGVVDRQVGHALLLGIAVLAGFAIVRVARASSPLVALALGVGAIGAIALRASPELAGTDGRFVAETWTVPGALSRVPSSAIVVCDGDDSCGGALYAQLCEGARPDVEVIPRPFLGTPSVFGPRLVASVALLDAALRNGERPILVQGGGEAAYPRPTSLDRALPLLRLGPSGLSTPAAPRLASLDVRLCGTNLDDCPPLTAHLLAQAHLGPITPLMRSSPHEAEGVATLGISVDPTLSALWNDRAVARAQQGRLDEALGDVRRSIELEPTRVTPRSNLVQWLAFAGRDGEARAALGDLDATCRHCVSARILTAAFEVRDGAPERTLLALEQSAKSRHDLWCRSFVIAHKSPPKDACGPP